MHHIPTLIAALLACFVSSAAYADPSEGPRGRKISTDATVLIPNQADAPAGFDALRPKVSQGRIEDFDYISKSNGKTYRATVHLPAGYSPKQKYPVFYLLHGASGDETTWIKEIHAAAILDNLHADRKAVPMIVVMPAIFPSDEQARGVRDRQEKTRESAAFTEVMLRDLIPLVETRFGALADRDHRALAGLSMGGGLALNIGLLHPDQFAWIGAFSGGSTRRFDEGTSVDLAAPKRKPNLLWISVGHQDRMMAAGMSAADEFLTTNRIPHVFRINSGGHEPKVWMNDLYHFAPLLFKTPAP